MKTWADRAVGNTSVLLRLFKLRHDAPPANLPPSPDFRKGQQNMHFCFSYGGNLKTFPKIRRSEKHDSYFISYSKIGLKVLFKFLREYLKQQNVRLDFIHRQLVYSNKVFEDNIYINIYLQT